MRRWSLSLLCSVLMGLGSPWTLWGNGWFTYCACGSPQGCQTLVNLEEIRMLLDHEGAEWEAMLLYHWEEQVRRVRILGEDGTVYFHRQPVASDKEAWLRLSAKQVKITVWTAATESSCALRYAFHED